MFKLVIACSPYGGQLPLWADSDEMDEYIKNTWMPMNDLKEKVPDGIWVLEGKITAERINTPYGYDYDVDFVSDYREPTPEEWEKIKDGENPWVKE